MASGFVRMHTLLHRGVVTMEVLTLEWRHGIIRHFIVHSVEIDGKQAIHAFVIVNWLRLSEQDFGFGSPLSVWYARNFEDSGPAVFLPLQRIHSKFLFACKLYSGQQYLICSPICMRIFALPM